MERPTHSELPPPATGVAQWPWSDRDPASVAGQVPWPRISVVMPSLNQGRFLEAAIRSVLLQRYPDVELIVIDGDSTDGSTATLARYRPWLAHCVSEPDAGPADALNKGFRLATGDVLAYLNADDLLLPDALGTVARAFLARPDADVLSGHGFLAGPSGDLGPAVFSDRWHLSRFMHGACVLLQPATFFRRRPFERTRGFSARTRTAWDMELWADLAGAGARFELLNEFLAVQRLHSDSITGRAPLRQQRLRDARLVREKVKGRREESGDLLRALLHRAHKFSTHPLRTFRQRRFVHGVLYRWSL